MKSLNSLSPAVPRCDKSEIFEVKKIILFLFILTLLLGCQTGKKLRKVDPKINLSSRINSDYEKRVYSNLLVASTSSGLSTQEDIEQAVRERVEEEITDVDVYLAHEEIFPSVTTEKLFDISSRKNIGSILLIDVTRFERRAYGSHTSGTFSDSAFTASTNLESYWLVSAKAELIDVAGVESAWTSQMNFSYFPSSTPRHVNAADAIVSKLADAIVSELAHTAMLVKGRVDYDYGRWLDSAKMLGRRFSEARKEKNFVETGVPRDRQMSLNAGMETPQSILKCESRDLDAGDPVISEVIVIDEMANEVRAIRVAELLESHYGKPKMRIANGSTSWSWPPTMDGAYIFLNCTVEAKSGDSKRTLALLVKNRQFRKFGTSNRKKS